jgi:hypothetical protein
MTTTERDTTISLPAALTGAAGPPLANSIIRGRAAVAEAAAVFLAVPDELLTRTWLFRGVDTEDGVRYGMYRGAETVEAASAELEAALAGAPARAPAAIRIAPSTIARWGLQGRLIALDDTVLDPVARDGEWTVRRTLGHVIDGQRSYGWFTRWWLSLPPGERRPSRPTADAEAASERDLPGEIAEGEGTLLELRSRLDAVLDEWALRFAGLDSATLAASASWAGVAVDIDFRLGRWASHIAEHTIQIDKTLDWLGYQPTEPARIVRQLFEAWGRLEARLFPVAPDGTEAVIAPIIEQMSEMLVGEARSVREVVQA